MNKPSQVHRQMNRTAIFLLFLLLILSSLPTLSLSQTLPTKLARERTYHVVHYRINIDLDEQQRTCEGDVTISFVPLRPDLDTIRVDAGEMKIQRVTLAGKSLQYTYDSSALHIALDKSYSLNDTLPLQISYQVTAPTKGLYFIAPDSGYPDKKFQIWSQGQPEDNHFWFPCYDYPNDKATSEMIATVNDQFTVISNGTLLNVKKDAKRHTATYHWSESRPFSSYLISIIAGDFVEVKEEWRGKRISYFINPDQKDNAMLSFGKTTDALEYFSTYTGYQFPWEKYSQTVIQDFMFGGMENVSATTLTDATIHDERAHLDINSDGLMAHELAHQWFGDLVTPRDWSQAWLSEGFATFFDMMFEGQEHGKDELDKLVLDTHRSLLLGDAGTNRRPSVWNHYHEPIELYDNHIYGKGAIVLHMLRYELGDDVFKKCLLSYIERYKFGLVETNDFKLAIEDVSGRNLTQFFDQWIYKAGYPEFHITSSWDQAAHVAHLTVQQTQKVDSLTDLFTTPVDVQVWVNDKPQLYRVTISKEEEEFSFPAEQQPRLVIFDKENKILKKVDYDKPVDEWIYQLNHAEDGVDRLLAIDGLRRSVDSADVFTALSKIVINDPVWYVRQSAAYALGPSKQKGTQDILHSVYGDRDSRVRTAVISSLGNFKNDAARKDLQYAINNDRSYYVISAALHSLAAVDTTDIVAYCDSALQQDSYHDIIRTTALNILADQPNQTPTTIENYTRYGVARDLRIEALSLLGRKWGDSSDVVDYIIGFLSDPSFQIRRAVMAILGATGNERAIKPLQHSSETEHDGRLIKLAQGSITRIQDTITKGKK